MIRLSCASLSAEGFQDSGFEKTFSMIPAAGFKYIELNLWFGRMILPKTIESIKSRCYRQGVEISSIYCTFLGGNPDRLDVDVAHKLYCMDIALQLGCRR